MALPVLHVVSLVVYDDIEAHLVEVAEVRLDLLVVGNEDLRPLLFAEQFDLLGTLNRTQLLDHIRVTKRLGGSDLLAEDRVGEGRELLDLVSPVAFQGYGSHTQDLAGATQLHVDGCYGERLKGLA